MRALSLALLGVFGVSMAFAAGQDANITVTCGVAAGRDVSSQNITVNCGDAATLKMVAEVFAGQLATTIADKERAEKRAADIAKQADITVAAVQKFFKEVGQQDVSPDQIPSRLSQFATEIKQNASRLADIKTTDVHTISLVNDAQRALELGEVQQAALIVEEAEKTELMAQLEAATLLSFNVWQQEGFLHVQEKLAPFLGTSQHNADELKSAMARLKTRQATFLAGYMRILKQAAYGRAVNKTPTAADLLQQEFRSRGQGDDLAPLLKVLVKHIANLATGYPVSEQTALSDIIAVPSRRN